MSNFPEQTAHPAPQSTLAKAINATLADLLETNPRVILIGEDIGALGGVFRISKDLQSRFGKERVRNSVLAESTIIGQAIGMAISGLVPICEIQFDGFTYMAANQMITQAARIAHRWNGQAAANLIVRIPSGGGTRAVEHHSESNESFFARVPGIKVACPSTGTDYDQIIRYAIAAGGPCALYEPIRLYHRSRTEKRWDSQINNPLEARVIRPGTDLTVACYGSITQEVLQAARRLSERIDAEVIDLRWIAPLDTETVLASVRRTGRLLIVHEESITLGIGAELAAQMVAQGWSSLLRPVKRLAPPNFPYPPADRQDDYQISSVAIERAMEELIQ